MAAPDFSKAFNHESCSSSELKPSLKSVIKNKITQNDQPYPQNNSWSGEIGGIS